MARFAAPLEEDSQNESQPWPALDEGTAPVLDGGPEIEDARALYLETVGSPCRYVNKARHGPARPDANYHRQARADHGGQAGRGRLGVVIHPGDAKSAGVEKLYQLWAAR